MCAGNPAPLGELNATDGSEVLFKMYLEMAGDEDKEMAERWRADAKGTIIFVSLEITSAIYMPCQLKCRRLVCSLLLSLHSSPCRSRTSNQTQRIS